MNTAQIKCLIVLTVFAIIGFGPVSPTCLIGMYIVVARPRWFFDLTGDVYQRQPPLKNRESALAARKTRSSRIKCFLSLFGLFIVDIAPLPVTALIGLFVVLDRPLWFVRMVASIYGKDVITP